MFVFGVALSDIENINLGDGTRPLDKLRDVSIWWAIPRNLLLIFFFTSYGSYDGEDMCKIHKDYNCDYLWFATAGFYIPKYVCWYIGAISGVVLALVSDGTQWFLNTSVVQFLGRISYTLYLVHGLFLQWPQHELGLYFVNELDVPLMEAKLFVFLIFTPVLLLVAWLLELGVDTPAKNFANKLDVTARIEQPIPKVKTEGDNDVVEEVTWWRFCLRSWEIWALLAWFSLILIVTEVYGAIGDNRARLGEEALSD